MTFDFRRIAECLAHAAAASIAIWLFGSNAGFDASPASAQESRRPLAAAEDLSRAFKGGCASGAAIGRQRPYNQECSAGCEPPRTAARGSGRIAAVLWRRHRAVL